MLERGEHGHLRLSALGVHALQLLEGGRPDLGDGLLGLLHDLWLQPGERAHERHAHLGAVCELPLQRQRPVAVRDDNGRAEVADRHHDDLERHPELAHRHGDDVAKRHDDDDDIVTGELHGLDQHGEDLLGRTRAGILARLVLTDTATTSFDWSIEGSLPQLLEDGTDAYVYGPGATPIEQIDLTTAPRATSSRIVSPR